MTFSIIDTHQHLWDLSVLSLPWVNDVPQLNRSFGLWDYAEYTKPDPESEVNYEIEQTIYMEVDVAASDIQKETESILDICRDESNSLSGMIASTRPGTPEFDSTLEFASSHSEIKGFRRVLHTESTPPKTCLDSEFQSHIRTLAKHNLTFDLCMRRDELADVVRLAQSCPETLFVLDHCGNAEANMTADEFSAWELAIRSIAKCQNVVCKVSGFVWTIQNSDWSYENDIEPILRVVFESFEEDRLLFGGDWPVCTLSQLSFSQWVDAIHRFACSYGESTAEKLFQSNAKRVYRLV